MSASSSSTLGSISDKRTYRGLLQELAERTPSCRFETADEVPVLAHDEAAIVMRSFPDLMAEAHVDHINDFADAMSIIDTTARLDLTAISITGILMWAVRERARRYIWSDLKEMAALIASSRDDETDEEGADSLSEYTRTRRLELSTNRSGFDMLDPQNDL